MRDGRDRALQSHFLWQKAFSHLGPRLRLPKSHEHVHVGHLFALLAYNLKNIRLFLFWRSKVRDRAAIVIVL